MKWETLPDFCISGGKATPRRKTSYSRWYCPTCTVLPAYLMRRERRDHSMQPTDLVDQIYFRLVAAKDRDWQDRKHFFAIAARAMRRYLIDHARARPNAEFIPMEGMENLIPPTGPRLKWRSPWTGCWTKWRRSTRTGARWSS